MNIDVKISNMAINNSVIKSNDCYCRGPSFNCQDLSVSEPYKSSYRKPDSLGMHMVPQYTCGQNTHINLFKNQLEPMFKNQAD